jgi:hypothetical protein
MWRNEEQNSMHERIRQMSDEELIRMVGDEADQYRDDVLQYAEAELVARGVELEEEDEPNQQASAIIGSRKLDESLLTCAVCHSRMRAGALFAQKEITILFNDNNEERFVEVLACSKCGQVRLLVDYDTDVEGVDYEPKTNG